MKKLIYLIAFLSIGFLLPLRMFGQETVTMGSDLNFVENLFNYTFSGADTFIVAKSMKVHFASASVHSDTLFFRGKIKTLEGYTSSTSSYITSSVSINLGGGYGVMDSVYFWTNANGDSELILIYKE